MTDMPIQAALDAALGPGHRVLGTPFPRGPADREGRAGDGPAEDGVPGVAAPAFSPVAAIASPETPIVTCSGTAARISATCARARVGSAGTPGIFSEAMPGSSAMRAYSSVVKVKRVVPGLS